MTDLFERLRAVLQQTAETRSYAPHVPTRITAHRGDDDEPWRFVRAAQASGLIDFLTEKGDLLLGVHDHKGMLSVNWRTVEDYHKYRHHAATAWLHCDGSDEMVYHYVQGQSQELDRLEKEYPGSSYNDCLTILQRGITIILKEKQ